MLSFSSEYGTNHITLIVDDVVEECLRDRINGDPFLFV